MAILGIRKQEQSRREREMDAWRENEGCSRLWKRWEAYRREAEAIRKKLEREGISRRETRLFRLEELEDVLIPGLVGKIQRSII